MLESLYKEALNRKENPKEGSYTNYLFDKGLDKILKKVGEEATEVVIGAKNADQAEIANETADLLYHLAVMLVETGVSLDEVEAVLQARQGKQSKIQDRPEIAHFEAPLGAFFLFLGFFWSSQLNFGIIAKIHQSSRRFL